MRRLDATLWPVPGVLASCLVLGACSPPEADGEASSRGPVDRVLTFTWEPRSGEVIDCRGGSIRPWIAPDDNNGISVPDTLIFLKDVTGVRIQDCTLEGTFAVVAAGGGMHRITGNTIRSSGVSVMLASSDGNLIDHNAISSVSTNIIMRGDSDGNVVWRNDITDHAGPAAGEYPGFAEPGDAGALGVGGYTYPGVMNLVVNGKLTQVVTRGSDLLDRPTVLDNDIHMDEDEAWGGIIFATRSKDGLAVGNRVSGVYEGISVYGWDDGASFLEPGTCSLDPSRACGDDEDMDASCNIPGFPAVGTCEGTSFVQGGGRVYSPSFIGNEVSDTVYGGWSSWPTDLQYIGNDLRGGEFGLLLEGYSLERGTVRGNVVEGFSVGLLLSDFDYALVERSDLEVSFNDFGGNAVPFAAVQTSDSPPDFPLEDNLPYPLGTTLSDNWWGGAPCGFPEDASWPLLEDPNAAADPIAEAWRHGGTRHVARCD